MSHMPTRSLLLIALVAGACASTPDGSAQDLAGCYYFEQDATARELNLPWGVRLTAEPLTGWPPLEQEEDVRVAVTLIGEEETADHPFGYWRPMADDSVRIGYPGTGGFVVDLVVGESELVGTATPVGDAGLDDRPVHDVRLMHARCPGPSGGGEG